MTTKAQEAADSLATLKANYIPATKRVYVRTVGRSASGLTHYFTLHVTGLNNSGEPDIFNITYHTARALGYKLVDKDGLRCIKMQGGGMDLGFHIVYELSSALYPEQERAGYVLSKAVL